MDQLIVLLKSVTADEFNKVVLGSVALISLVVSPIMQWRISRKQVLLQEQIAKRQADLQTQIATRQAADNISAKRQVWIDDLRKEAAEYLTLLARLEELQRPGLGISLEDKKSNFEDLMEANKRATELGILIKLRLNAKEDEHNEFLRLLGVLAEACKKPPPNETELQRTEARRQFGVARNNVITHLQTILKHEWERVKKGDM